MPEPKSHTWNTAVKLAPRLLKDRDALLRQLHQARTLLERMLEPGGRLEPLADDVTALPALVWAYSTGECRGPAYSSVTLALSALNYTTASTHLADLLRGRDSLEDVFGYVCRAIALDLQDFKRWREGRYRSA